ncbi:11664_t:CDS:10, partial [Gigaspora margarita]
MHLLTDCLNALKTHEFWKSTDNPSLKKFLDFRFQKGVLEDKKTEYSQYKSELDTIKRYYSETSENGKKLDKKSQSLISFWDSQTKRQTIHMNSKIFEEEAQLQQTRQILDATKDIRNQDNLLREITTKQIEKDLLNENLEEEAPSTPPDKIRTVPFNKQENDAIASDSDDDFQKVAESMIGKVERTALMVDNVDLEEIFEDYCNECDNIFEKIPEVIWEKFVTNTYPEYKISEIWEKLIQDTFKPKKTLAEWMEVWRELYAISDKNESNRDPVMLVIKDVIYNILTPYIEAFKAPYNILKSGDLGENQYNSQFVSPILNNTFKAILDINWRILEVPVESSKHRRNANINPMVDKVLEAKRADGLARLWQNHEEVFIYEQTGPPDFDDVTQLFIHDYKLIRTMRDVLNQRIMLRLRDGISDHKDLASFGAFGHRTEVKADNVKLKHALEKYEARFVNLEQRDKEKTCLIAKLDDNIKEIKQSSANTSVSPKINPNNTPEQMPQNNSPKSSENTPNNTFNSDTCQPIYTKPSLSEDKEVTDSLTHREMDHSMTNTFNTSKLPDDLIIKLDKNLITEQELKQQLSIPISIPIASDRLRDQDSFSITAESIVYVFYKAIQSGQEGILYWYYFIEKYDKKIDEVVINHVNSVVSLHNEAVKNLREQNHMTLKTVSQENDQIKAEISTSASITFAGLGGITFADLGGITFADLGGVTFAGLGGVRFISLGS